MDIAASTVARPFRRELISHLFRVLTPPDPSSGSGGFRDESLVHLMIPTLTYPGRASTGATAARGATGARAKAGAGGTTTATLHVSQSLALQCTNLPTRGRRPAAARRRLGVEGADTNNLVSMLLTLLPSCDSTSSRQWERHSTY